MKCEIVMRVTEVSDGILAEFEAGNKDISEAIVKFTESRLLELSLKNTLERKVNCGVSFTVPDKQILKEILNGKPLDFGALYPTAFTENIREVYSEENPGNSEELEIVFSEPQKPYIIRDNMKLSKFLLAVVFATCGVGVSAYGVTLFNLSILPVVFGKAAGLIVPIIGLFGFGIFCRFFNQPGGRR